MSFNGNKTPLQVNVEASLNYNKGFRINRQAAEAQGVWSAAAPYGTPTTATYTPGTLVTGTVLYDLTRALPLFYALTPGTLCVKVWRNLLRIGRPVENTAINCPALGNTRPDAFLTSYAGWGSFKDNSSIDEYGNITTSPDLGLVEEVYPPKNWPATGEWSYIYKNWGSITPTPGWPIDCTQTTWSPYTDPVHWHHPYAWITGWPGANTWQAKTPGNPQVAVNPADNGDTWAAAYYPRPDLAPVQPWRARDLGKIEYDEYFKNGFIATAARQAYYEFWSSYGDRRPNQYAEFSKAVQQAQSYMQAANQEINTYLNNKTFLKGNYSNINDLTTSDFAGVNLAFKLFGNDMIRLGKAVDLQWIHLFGLPSKLLLTLQAANALTEALRLALLYSELSVAELGDIFLPTYTPGKDQEKKIWTAFNLIAGDDLEEIKVIINCSTVGLETLADLINPKKMFPTSYASLTVPAYSINTLQSKTYTTIYVAGGVNTAIRDWGGYLTGILPDDLALACGAFMAAINQVKNIGQMSWEKIAQSVANLEVVDKDLTLLATTNGVPGNLGLADSKLDLIALGSGEGGAYRFCDYFGSMAGQPYVEWYARVDALLKQLATPALGAIYSQLYTYAVGGVFTSAQIQTLIDAANAEIFAIQSANTGLVAELNYWWNKIGRQMWIEQRALAVAIPRTDNVWGEAGPPDISALISNLENYALDTLDYGAATILEAVADNTVIGGQSITAALREARNAQRIINAGGELDNDLPPSKPCPIPLVAEVSGGSVTVISAEGIPAGYDDCNPPAVTVVPQAGVFGVGSLDIDALNTGSGCTFSAVIADYPAITTVVPGWMSSLGVVSASATAGPNYTITVDGACFEPGMIYSFISPQVGGGVGATATATVDAAGAVTEITVTSGGSGYVVVPTVIMDCPPAPSKLGGPVVPGSFAGSPWTGQDPVPDNLISADTSSYTVEEAIATVEQCNCNR